MFGILLRHFECLTLVLLCVTLMQSQMPVHSPPSAQAAGVPLVRSWKILVVAGAFGIPSAKQDMRSLSTVRSLLQQNSSHSGYGMPAPESVPGVFAHTQAAGGKEVHRSQPASVMGKPSDVVQPPLNLTGSGTLHRSSTSSWLSSHSLLLRASLSSYSSSLESSAPAPLRLPTSEASNISGQSTVSPLLSQSPGCCLARMVPRPGLPSSSCICVYPILVQLLFEDVSDIVANWSGLFQQDLASELGIETVQIEITSFHFNSSKVSLAITIVPLRNVSFSIGEANHFEAKLDQHKVRFNRSLFGNYTLVQFQFYEPLAPSSPQVPVAGLPLLPTAGQFPPTHAMPVARDVHKHSLWLIVLIATAAAILSLVLLLLVLWKCHRHNRARSYPCKGEAVSSQREAGCFGATSIPRSMTTRLFTFNELRRATNNFSPDNILGEGGFGRVYKGALEDGTPVAIKRFGGSGQGNREFVVEIEMLSRLHHRNLVKLIGYYASGDTSQHLLCYELISNGSLESWLHGPKGSTQPLDWETRVKIALDAARGLMYLHEDSQPCVIHRDLKASNILLESNFHAKVADFGLAKLAPEGPVNYVTTQVMGTFGYVAPEYAMTGHLLVKSDVYSYGVVLLELLSGRKPVDMSQPSGEENLVTWARPLLRDRDCLTELADSRLENNYPMEDFVQVAAIAAACVAPEASQRPTMGEVLQSLRMLQTQSECTTSGERRFSTDVLPSLVPSRFLVASFQNAHQHTPATFESDGSSSVFSSGPFSAFAFENEIISKSAMFSSEDLHEGR